jgi:predicted transcriptional regulator
MKGKDGQKHRSRCRIFADILRVIMEVEDPKVTYLMHKANLSYERLLYYLDELEKKGLIERKGNGEKSIAATTKGRKYLMEFRRFEEFGDAFGVEI